MPFSHHSHSGQFCKHAKGTLEEVVQEAIRQKFRVYGLTEHVPRYRVEDLYPEEANVSLEELSTQFNEFIEEAHRLKVLYAPQITILVGAETEVISDLDISSLDVLLRRHRDRIEYLVGSVHHVNEIPIDFDLPTFQKAIASLTVPVPNIAVKPIDPMEAMFDCYLDAQYKLLVNFRPEVIGHFDLCRLYHPHMSLQGYHAVWEKVKRNVRYFCEYGALVEFNAAAFRKGWETAYPGREIVKLILEHGGRFTLSDDSHGPHAVGLNYGKLHGYLMDLGITELWYLTREGNGTSGRCLTPAKELDWWTNEFWVDKVKPRAS